MISAVTKYNWSQQKQGKHIAAHIDFVKFGREDYGFGFGAIDITTRDGYGDVVSQPPATK
jgi:hypothetical protein